jgi:hypothetical protein
MRIKKIMENKLNCCYNTEKEDLKKLRIKTEKWFNDIEREINLKERIKLNWKEDIGF